MGVVGLGYLGFETARLDEWKSFAAEVLGLMVEPPGPHGEVALRMDERAARIVLHPGADERLRYIGWEVSDDAALDVLCEQLTAGGVETRPGSAEEQTARRVQTLLHAADPAGHALELFTGAEAASEPFVASRPVEFRTGALGLGHIVVQVDDPFTSVQFYREQLGFQLSDQLREALFFLRCNPRHHSIGIAHIGGDPRTLHVMIELEDFDDVGTTFDLCLERGIRVSTLGLHTNDRMTSFYLQTPSGFEIECGWNGLLVDDATWEQGFIDRPSIWGHHQLDPEHPPGPRAFRRVPD